MGSKKFKFAKHAVLANQVYGDWAMFGGHALEIGKKTNVKIRACGKMVKIIVDSKFEPIRFADYSIIDHGRESELHLSADDYHACDAKLSNFRLFRALKRS